MRRVRAPGRCRVCGHNKSKPGQYCTACSSFRARTGRERPYREDGRTERFVDHNPSGLQPRWGEALALREAGLGYAEIVARMGVTICTAKSYVKWARQAVG